VEDKIKKQQTTLRPRARLRPQYRITTADIVHTRDAGTQGQSCGSSGPKLGECSGLARLKKPRPSQHCIML
jgi:hypothetical protein